MLIAVSVALGGLALLAFRTEQGFAAAGYVWTKMRGGYTVDERVRMHSSSVEARTKSRFERAGVPYPPTQLAYVAFKDKAQLQVYSRETSLADWRLVHTYSILGMSGTAGPKLRRGDMQVPEGIYRAEFLNANSRFHLSIRLDYPNDLDRAHAATDGRTDLGSDIMIHGTTSSIGCLAMGNEAAEDLFILAALAGRERVEIIVAPTDLRRTDVQIPEGAPSWLAGLYAQIKAALSRFPGEA